MLNNRSLKRLEGVHPLLVAVIGAAAVSCPVEFQVTQGVRTEEQQKDYFDSGKSKTLNSLHLKQKDGFSHAVDIVVIINGAANWDLRNYRTVAKFVKSSAIQLGADVEWGGDWVSLVDGPHFQLKRK